INAVFGLSSTSVWAATEGGQILFYNGSSWTVQFTAPAGTRVRSISGSSKGYIWAVGENSSAQPKIDGSVGGTWSEVASPVASGGLYGVWSAGSEAYMVGFSSGGGITTIVQKWDGTSWNNVSGNMAGVIPLAISGGGTSMFLVGSGG